MPTRELKTFDDFRQVRLDDAGFIAITDGTRHATVHKLNGQCVSADKFKAKLLDKGQAGAYFWADTVQAAALGLGAAPCRVCKPHKAEKPAWRA
ncbi:MAG: hypothetical protein JRN23_01015 [Nitrososphaerota archaeon]|nr:hypothetical protein [Nitrososphaerota archaeon]MDG6978195.1 hypothetical protein [Nitrososphaerota archaeon]MDG7020492.1 hypothetical protein [Nitrososphaerota archaeon]